MGTYTPNTTLLVQHVATQLATIVTPAWRTNIGANVSTERQQELDDAAPFCSVVLAGWESQGGGVQTVRVCDLRIEAVVSATDANAEAQARLAAEDIFELFRRPAGDVTLAAGVFALLRPVSAAEITRTEGSNAIVATLNLSAELRET